MSGFKVRYGAAPLITSLTNRGKLISRQEAQTTRIEVVEEDQIIETILRHIYEQPWLPSKITKDDKDCEIVPEINRLLRINIAADKV